MLCRLCLTPNPPSAVTCRACGVPLALPEPPRAETTVSAPTQTKAAAPTATPPLPVGTRLRDGLFATGRVLHQTRFGLVYLGSDTSVRQPVTITELCLAGCKRDDLRLSPNQSTADTIERAQHAFLDEGHLLSRLNHASLETVVTTFAENNTIYRITEFVRGQSALQLTRNRLSEDEAVKIVTTVGEALATARAADLWHGSISPEAIIAADQRIVLTGFGAGIARQSEIAALLHRPSAGREYFAPEAASVLDARTEVYALAATIYHLLTGQAPTPAHERGADAELMEVSWLNPQLSRHIAQAVMAALSLAPDARPQNVREFLDLLKAPPVAIPEQPESTPKIITPIDRIKALKPRLHRPEPVAEATKPEVTKPETKEEPSKPPETTPAPRPAPRPAVRRVIHPFATGQAPRVRLRLQGQESGVLALAFSQDSAEIMSIGEDHNVRIWSTRAGALMQTTPLKPPAPQRGRKRNEPECVGLHCAAIAPDGDLVACGYESGSVRIWEIPSGNVRHTLKGHAGRVNDMMFSSDGVWLASGSNDSTTMLWETEEGEEQQTMSEESDGVRVLALSHDDRWIATGGDRGAIRVWNAWSSDLAWQQDGHEFWATALAFAANNKVLASGSYDRTIRIWSVEQGRHLQTLSGHEGCIAGIAFHPDGSTLASAALDGTIRIWHAPSAQLKHTLTGHDDAMRCIIFSPDGSTLASAGGEEIRLWQAG